VCVVCVCVCVCVVCAHMNASGEQFTCYLSSLTLYSDCSRHGVVAVRLTAERPGSVTPVSKTFTLLGVHS